MRSERDAMMIDEADEGLVGAAVLEPPGAAAVVVAVEFVVVVIALIASAQVNLSVQASVGAPADTTEHHWQKWVESAAQVVLSVTVLQAVHWVISAAFVAQLPDDAFETHFEVPAAADKQ